MSARSNSVNPRGAPGFPRISARPRQNTVPSDDESQQQQSYRQRSNSNTSNGNNSYDTGYSRGRTNSGEDRYTNGNSNGNGGGNNNNNNNNNNGRYQNNGNGNGSGSGTWTYNTTQNDSDGSYRGSFNMQFTGMPMGANDINPLANGFLGVNMLPINLPFVGGGVSAGPVNLGGNANGNQRGWVFGGERTMGGPGFGMAGFGINFRQN